MRRRGSTTTATGTTPRPRPLAKPGPVARGRRPLLYAFCGNDSVNYFDIVGLVLKIDENAPPEFRKRVGELLIQIKLAAPAFKTLLDILHASPRMFRIRPAPVNLDEDDGDVSVNYCRPFWKMVDKGSIKLSSGDEIPDYEIAFNGADIYINPFNDFANSKQLGPAVSSLLHELWHAYEFEVGIESLGKRN
ncbi:hypothetical protein NXS98_07505 [Fontisphaera persica]|uniref:hypothetical protein n=1 Tax=Fontisphaera persica TaxID=2974023 RepID=UPI0024C057F4|nr:hypothetical protein [Fontisphaera persica]WCJ60956.1 hypothetical protein NXS98_07505 [Fontisphaera persica]